MRPGRWDRVGRWARLAFALKAVALAALWFSSFRRYTTIGFDFGRRVGPLVATIYDRLRWDAGVFWIGQAEQVLPPHGETLDWFDPGGTLFATSIPPAPRSLANRLGFWRITDVAEDPYEPIRYPGATSSRWVGLPGFLPPALAAGLAFRLRSANPSSRRGKATKIEGDRAIM